MGTTGEFVVTWDGVDSAGDYSIFVQKFHANGTAVGGGAVQLESGGQTDQPDRDPQITAVGTTGEFVVVWAGYNANSDATVHVQKFTASGSASGSPVALGVLRLGAASVITPLPQVTAVGTGGEFVMAWRSPDATSDATIYVQKFNASGGTSGSVVLLDATGVSSGIDQTPQITAVGTAGEFVVTWSGIDDSGDSSIFVQKFHANGNTSGDAVQLEAIGKTNGSDSAPQITAVGSAGEFVVTWSGVDSGGDTSIYVQKFNADGSLPFSRGVVSNAAELASSVVPVQSNELGRAFLVKNTIDLSTGIAALTAANQRQWNEVAITAIGTDTNISTAGLVNGSYDLYAVDESGNLSQPVRGVLTVMGVVSVPVFTSASSAVYAENRTGAVYTAVASPDVPGAAVSFSISGGADSAQFSINSSSGVVGFISSPNFETPTDVGGNNVYDVVISATESGNTLAATRSVTVTVSNVGDVAPVFSSGSSASFAENSTGAVYTALSSPDVSGAAVSYSISGGADSARFSINSSGVVSFVSSPNHESPTDVGGNNVYDVVISATESGNSLVATRNLVVTVSDVSDVSPVFSSGGSVSFFENATGAVYTAAATPDAGGAVSYSISGGADSAQFSINSSNGVVSFKASPNFETPTDVGGNNVYAIVIRATEANNTVVATHSVVVRVLDLAEADPTWVSTSSAAFAENGTGAVYTALATANAGGSISYLLLVGDDVEQFSINSSSGVISFISSPNHESPTDTGANNVYDLIVFAIESDSSFVATLNVAVTVTDVADVAPVFTSASSASFAENATGAVYTAVVVSDVLGASIGYSISGGADSAQFSINSSSGVVSFIISPNHDVPTDAGANNVYDIVVSATEANNTNTATRSVAVTVTQPTEADVIAPIVKTHHTALSLNGTASSGSSADALLQATAVGTAGEFVVSWKETQGTYTGVVVQKFAANGKASGSAVELDSSTAVTRLDAQVKSVGTAGEFVMAWGLGSPGNLSSIKVQKFLANGDSSGQPVSINPGDGIHAVADLHLQLGSLGSSGQFILSWVVRHSNDEVSMYVQKFDAMGVAMGAAVEINTADGFSATAAAPQWTALGTEGEWVVLWNESSVSTSSIFVQKIDANGSSSGSAVELGFGPNAVDELDAQATAVGTAGEFVVVWSGLDTDSERSVFVQKFTASGVQSGSAVKLEAISRTDGDDITPQVTAVGTAGEFVVVWQGLDNAGDNSIFVQKFNASGSTSGGIVQLEATGKTNGYDEKPQVTAVGTAGEFVVVWQGQDSNFENRVYVQQFAANGSASGGTVQLDAPVNAAATDSAPQVVAVGTAGEFMVTWSGVDSAGDSSVFVQKFAATGGLPDSVVVSSATELATAVVRVQSNELGKAYLVRDDISLSAGIAALTSANQSQWNEVAITVVDGVTNLSAAGLAKGSYDLYAVDAAGNLSQPVRGVLTVNSFAATFTSGSITTYAENGTGAVYTASATPNAAGAMSYSISGGADSVKFSINSSSGVVSFNSSPNHESPTDAGGNNIYDIVIQATESGSTFVATRSVAVVVTDVGEVAPVFTSVGSATFAENGTAAVYTAVATPNVPWAIVSYSISGGADSAKFSINGSSGVVGWKSSPDFETPTDAGSNSIYDLVVSATESGSTFVATRSVAVTVSNVVETDPSITSGGSASFVENSTGAVYTARASASDADGSITYSISGGSDSAQFSINSSSGVVSFNSSPNFEAPTDAGGNNIYDIVIQATESGSTFVATRSVAVTVSNVVETAPSITSGGSASFVENSTGAVYTARASASDADGSITYSISGGSDSAQFSINSSSGVVSFNSSPNFEAPTDAGGNNIYDLVVSATEAGSTFVATRSVAVTVTDVDEIAPIVQLSSIVKLEFVRANGEAITDANDIDPQVSAVGTAGEFVVVWTGQEGNTPTISVQRFAANGTVIGDSYPHQGVSSVWSGFNAYNAQITAVGTAGEFVVTHSGHDLQFDNSIFVQKFAANGSLMGSVVILEATGNANGSDDTPQTTAVGTAGEFVVTWSGIDSNGDTSIFVQKFHANGTAVSGGAVKLEATGKTDGADVAPQITAVGTAGEFVVTWDGVDSGGDRSIFVQKFHANGAVVSGGAVQLESGGHLNEVDRDPQVTAVGTAGEFVVVWTGYDTNSDATVHVQKFTANGSASGSPVALLDGLGASLVAPLPQVTAVGTAGEFVVTWSGVDSGGDRSIFVQEFHANGAAVSGGAVKLEATGKTDGADVAPQITAVGTTGEFVVTWSGIDSNGDSSIFVQKFHANGTAVGGGAVQLEATGVTNGEDSTPQITAVGTAGEFVVTWSGIDSGGDSSTYVQKFDADGSPAFDPVVVSSAAELASSVVPVQSNELGKAYLVKNDFDLSAGIAALTAANETQWNEVAITAIGTDTNISTAGLVNGSYDLYAVDAAGNLSQPVRGVLTVMGV